MTEDRVAPRTAAGRRLFTDVDPMDMWESDGVTWDDICRVEAEAASLDRDEARYAAVMEDNVSLRADRDELRKAVEALPTGSGRIEREQGDYTIVLGSVDAYRAEVLALLSAGDKAEAPPTTVTIDGDVWPWPGNTRLPWQVWNEVPHPDGGHIMDPDGFRGSKPTIVTWAEFDRARMECTLSWDKAEAPLTGGSGE